MRRSHAAKAIGGAVLLPVLVVAWWLASPLFLSTTVVEGLPPSTDGEALPTGTVTKHGALRDGDSFHKGSGQVAVYRAPEGSHFLRLENINVTNGPDLYVFLSTHPNPSNQQEVYTSGYVNLGKLKGNVGSQTYVLPPDTDPGQLRSVVVYCLAFHVVFSVASLQ